MIRVNLLPYDLRPVRHSPMPYIVSGLVLVAALLAMGMMYVGTRGTIHEEEAQLVQHKADLEALRDIINESNRLETQKSQLADKIRTIKEITSDRVIWSRQLWNLSRLAPDNFWYSYIGVLNKSVKEEQQVYDAQTKKTKMQTVTVQKPMLKVEGYVTEAKDGQKDVYLLLRTTEGDPEFAGMFTLEPPSFKDADFEGHMVKSFSLEYLIMAKGSEE